jgi:hypothetical protein
MISHPFETKSDSFYFVAVEDEDVERLILHNKAGEWNPSYSNRIIDSNHSMQKMIFHHSLLDLWTVEIIY